VVVVVVEGGGVGCAVGSGGGEAALLEVSESFDLLDAAPPWVVTGGGVRDGVRVVFEVPDG
jgi:hypothetical protein